MYKNGTGKYRNVVETLTIKLNAELSTPDDSSEGVRQLVTRRRPVLA